MAREMTGVGVTPSSALNDGLDAVGRQHLQRGALGRVGERVRVLAHEERTVDARACAGSRRWPG